MRYLGPDDIAYAPHTGEKAINITLAEKLGLDQNVIETMQQLPYFENNGGGWMQPGQDILWQDGHFVDYRHDYNIWISRDPLLRGKTSTVVFKGDKIDSDPLPKSAVPLSVITPRRYLKYGLSIILDTASNRIVVLDTQDGGLWNSDPFFAGFDPDNLGKDTKMKGIFYGQELMHGRLGSDFLREFILELRGLDRDLYRVPYGEIAVIPLNLALHDGRNG